MFKHIKKFHRKKELFKRASLAILFAGACSVTVATFRKICETFLTEDKSVNMYKLYDYNDKEIGYAVANSWEDIHNLAAIEEPNGHAWLFECLGD